MDVFALDAPHQQGTDDEERGKIDAGAPDSHHQAEALEAAVMAQRPEESEAAGRDESAQQQRPVADIPPFPDAAGIVNDFAIAMHHEDAVFVAGADKDGKA